MRLIYPHVKPKKDLLVALGAGVIGHDAILKEGHDAAARNGFALTRLGKVEEAAIAIEGGRARGLAEAMQFNTVDAQRISDPERRSRFTEAHHELQTWQAEVPPLPKRIDKPVMAFEAREGDEYALVSPHQLVAVRGRVNRFDALQAEEIIQAGVEEQDQDIHPYADPYYWAGFQITGW